ncbi:DUF2510 domain-containing protein [Microcella sp.]|uniref:DUF2510 domain-containing protein n=1 Tax=Microcella sp. TaxID=1913979 RepID=UPI00299F589E|nr:DUF2510 domain-containing protein [Microcella sp.]MDX2026587.1 DUF2510 domain-containing protein [Microcella sp.]
MSRNSAIHVPAGWYADPVQVAASGIATQRRWWDGSQWTHHVAALETPVSPAVSYETLAAVTSATAAASGSSSRPSSAAIASSATVGLAPATVSPSDSARAAESMPLHTLDPQSGKPLRSSRPGTYPASTALAPHGSTTYEPFSIRNSLTAAAHRTARATRNPLHLRVNTVSIWLMATMPLTQALLVFLAFSAPVSDSSAMTRILAVTLPFVLTAALAGQDTRLMRAAGHSRTAPWITGLIAPPVYLAVRGVRIARTTGVPPWPLVVWIVAQLAVFAVWIAIDPTGVESLMGGPR